MILGSSRTGKGLTWSDSNTLQGFTIAGSDKKFIPASGIIKGKQTIAYNSQIPSPVAVRYGWANVPEVNFYNADGLPASPIRTDKD